MQQTCTQCGSMIAASSRFCTNCGASREISQPQAYSQSWGVPQVQNPSQVPPWAQAQGGMYQQQMYSASNQNASGLPGSGSAPEDQATRLMKIAGLVILGAVALFITCVALAIVISIDSVRTFFIVVAVLLIVIPWIIYAQIRRIVRRTIGNFWRFF